MKRSIGWPMIAALLAAVLLLTAGIGMARYEDDLYSTQQTRDVTEQAQILAASVTAAVSFGDEKAAQEYVDALRVNPELQAAAVYGGDGRLIAGFARDTRLPALMKQASAQAGEGYLDVAVPVSQDGAQVGIVLLRRRK